MLLNLLADPACRDRAITRFDDVLRTATGVSLRSTRARPGLDEPDAPMSAAETRHAAGLMRVNHAGEVCAQALYVGQAAFARSEETRQRLLDAAGEEGDHLVWCAARLEELGAAPSRLGPLWFAGACGIGVVAALAGDRFSLGFVEETEIQVVRHLDGHRERLPESDRRSRAVVDAMREDEAAHAARAREAGARELPEVVKKLMAVQARVMTTLAYRI